MHVLYELWFYQNKMEGHNNGGPLPNFKFQLKLNKISLCAAQLIVS